MPVPTSISDLSTTAASNYPSASEPPIDGDNHLRAHAAFIAQLDADKAPKASPTFTGTVTGPGYTVTGSTIPANGVYLPAANSVGLSSNSTERVRIDSSGNFLVGKTSTASGTTTDGFMAVPNGSGSGMVTYATNGGTGTALVVSTQADTQAVGFYRSGVFVGSISVANPGGTSYNTSSDERLKKNIVDAPDASSEIDSIRVVSFDWKASDAHYKWGVIAQELVNVAPHAVTPGDEGNQWSVDYSKLVPMLVKEIQSLRNRIAVLESA